LGLDPNLFNALRWPIRSIPDTCAPASGPVIFCSHPFRMEGGRTPFKAAGWMQASVNSLLSHRDEAFSANWF
jgi:hypothetical protein